MNTTDTNAAAAVDIDDILPRVRRPSRYAGNEFNIILKDWQAAVLRWALVFPDMYEIGMSHQGLQILYHVINDRADLLAERSYAPDTDLEELMRKRGAHLFALESKRPLGDFDVIGITLPYELCYTNILTILDLAHIPFRAADRDEDHPLIIGGGPGAFHPEPVADFFDAILVGDGEEAVLEVSDCILAAKQDKLSRAETLARLADIVGIYIPSLFVPQYKDGEFSDIQPLKDGYNKVKRRVLADIETYGDKFPPLAPLARIVHDRLGIEIARGCTRGCRFCQAGVIYRPVRERSPARIMELAEKGIEEGGFDELALLSLSTGDYSCINDLLIKLMDIYARQQVSVSMPSMRVGTLTPEIMEQIKRVRKTGFTLAPEAGTDRLRRVINKGITEEDLLSASKTAFDLGWKLLKFYFMFGLPTETPEDLEAVVELAQKAYNSSSLRGRRINVSIATFVPKPHTPFQRHGQLSVEDGFAKIDFLKQKFAGKNIQLKWNDPRQSYLEGVMSRGDRSLSTLIEKAWQLGARFDAWNEHSHLEIWQQAAADCQIDLDHYLRARRADEALPWQHIDCGVSEDFIEEEFVKAEREEYTPDCRVHGCQKCGLCDFKTIKPIAYNTLADKGWEYKSCVPAIEAAGDGHFYYKIKYSRLNQARLPGHLEVLEMFKRIFKRAALPLNYSQGYNPSPKISFSPALSLGSESLAEFLIVDLNKPLADLAAMQAKLAAMMPTGFAITAIELCGRKQAEEIETCYEISLPQAVDKALIEKFLANDSYAIKVVRKGRQKTIDARPFVTELTASAADKIQLSQRTAISRAAVKPMELVMEIFALSEEDGHRARICKLWSKEFLN